MDIGHDPQREQLELFHAFSGELPARDAQDLMAYPFFSLAKSKRTVPIDFRTRSVTVRVEGTAEHGLATIWDADILIWAASQIVEARDAGIRSSRLMAATPYEILRFIGRGTSLRDYQRLKAALDRLQSTSIATSIRQPNARRLHRFSWINEWKERADGQGRPLGIELILPDWYRALAVPPGAQARWLAARRLALRFPTPAPQVRESGALHRFRLRPALHRGAATLAGLHARHSAAQARAGGADLPRRAVHGTAAARWQLQCQCSACGKAVNTLVLSGVGILVLSGVVLSCYQEYEPVEKPCATRVPAFPNLGSNFESIKLTIRRPRALWISRRAGGSAS